MQKQTYILVWQAQFFKATGRIKDDSLRLAEGVDLFSERKGSGNFTFSHYLAIPIILWIFWNKNQNSNPRVQVNRHVSAIFQEYRHILNAVYNSLMESRGGKERYDISNQLKLIIHRSRHSALDFYWESRRGTTECGQKVTYT